MPSSGSALLVLARPASLRWVGTSPVRLLWRAAVIPAAALVLIGGLALRIVVVFAPQAHA